MPDQPDRPRNAVLADWGVPCLLLFALSIALYWNTLDNGFVIDDVDVVADNTQIQIRSWQGVCQLFSTGYWERMGFVEGDLLYRPGTMLSFAVDYAVAGLKPGWYHGVNLVLNATVVVLAFLLVARLFGNRPLALIAAVAYAFLPCHVEAVAPVVGRSELLSALFGLLAWLLYLRGSTKSFVLSLALLAAAIMAKENAVVFPLLILAGDIVRHRLLGGRKYVSACARTGEFQVAPLREERHTPARTHAPGESLRRFVAASAMVVLYLWARCIVLGRLTIDPRVSYFRGRLWGIVWLSMGKYFFELYFRWLLLGTGMNPACLRPFYGDAAANDVVAWMLLAVLVLAAVVVLAIFLWRPSIAAYGALFFMLSIAPVSNFFVRIAALAGVRFLYIPSLGYCITAACLLWKVFSVQDVSGRFLRRAFHILLSLLLCVYSWLIVAGNTRFHDEETAYRGILEIEPQSLFAQHNLGATLDKNGNPEAARPILERVREREPKLDRVHYNLGLIYMEEGKLDLAEESFRRAIALDTGVGMGSDMHVALGNLLERKGDLRGARLEFLHGAASRYNNGKAHNNLANIYYKEGRLALAERHYRIAMQEEPSLETAWEGLGTVLVAEQRYQNAIDEVFDKALKEPKWQAWAFAGIGRCYMGLGNFRFADEALRRSLELEKDNLEALVHLATLYLKQRQFGKCIEAGERALQVGGDSMPELLHNMATAYERVDAKRALTLWQRFVELVDGNPKYAAACEAAKRRIEQFR